MAGGLGSTPRRFRHSLALMIYGAILASGSSTRMGRAKALLPLPGGGGTFVSRIADTLIGGGVDAALVVGKPEDEALRTEVEKLAPLVRYAENPHHASGQLSSVLAALALVDQPAVRGLLIVPVDMPLIRATTIATLIEAFNASPLPIARVTHRGRHGHPVIFGRAAFDELRTADPAQGARAVVHALPVLDVDVDDDGVVRDIDTPADYEKLLR
jgi:molybdenum cofactor cytidylyltransferase